MLKLVYQALVVTIFERRSVSTNGIMLYSASSHHQSHRLHKEHACIYITRRGKKGKTEREE